MVNLPISSTSHFVNFHFVNSHFVNIDQMGIDKVGINLSHVATKVMMSHCVSEQDAVMQLSVNI